MSGRQRTQQVPGTKRSKALLSAIGLIVKRE
jgi:hypothetical protein